MWINKRLKRYRLSLFRKGNVATNTWPHLVPKLLEFDFLQFLFERFLEAQNTSGRGKELVDCFIVNLGCIEREQHLATFDFAGLFHDRDKVNQAGDIAAGDYVHCRHEIMFTGNPMKRQRGRRFKQFHSKSSVSRMNWNVIRKLIIINYITFLCKVQICAI